MILITRREFHIGLLVAMAIPDRALALCRVCEGGDEGGYDDGGGEDNHDSERATKGRDQTERGFGERAGVAEREPAGTGMNELMCLATDTDPRDKADPQEPGDFTSDDSLERTSGESDFMSNVLERSTSIAESAKQAFEAAIAETEAMFESLANELFICVETPGPDQSGACIVMNGDLYSYNAQSAGGSSNSYSYDAIHGGIGGVSFGFAPYGAGGYLEGESVSVIFPEGVGLGISSGGPAVLVGSPQIQGGMGIYQGNASNMIWNAARDSARSVSEGAQEMHRQAYDFLYSNSVPRFEY